jgi:ABC-type bacteriocin/lantibiotic exporter with double-glycine peptidase domain
LVNIVDDLTLKLESGEMAALILLDFSKAFDRINHDLLMTKIKNRFGFSKSALALIRSFLSNRVPQGSILSPLLFAAFINNLSHVLNPVSYHLFADDVQLYDSAPRVDFRLCTDRLNSALERVSCWIKENGLLLNPN